MKYGWLNVLVLPVIGSMMTTPASAFAQGSLTPPGAPAPAMKTLDQVEPRTPVSSAPVTISQSGSYYLTTNLSGTVTVAANNVTLDLMGFSIVAASGNAIQQSGSCTNLLIRNGTLSAPFVNGIDFSTSSGNANGTIENLRITGCQNYGITVGGGYRVRNCQVNGVGMAGICAYGNSDIRECTLTGNGTGLRLSGTGAYVADNIVRGNTDNYDLSAGNQLNLLLCEVPESIDWPASVKFAGTLTCSSTATNGITVNANDVTLDLAGHTLIGPGATGQHGICQASTLRNLTVLNGKVTDWKGTYMGGVYVRGTGSQISGIQSATNYYGIITGNSSTISDCTASDNSSYGILTGGGCVLRSCVVSYNSSDSGIYAGAGSTLRDCTAKNNTGSGIAAGDGSMMSDCAASYNTGNGIIVYSGNTICDCTTSYNNGDGIRMTSDNRVAGCMCSYNGFSGDGAGIHATGSDNRIEDNNVTDNDRGIDVDMLGNFIVRNIASGNTTNWAIATGNVCLVVQAATAGAINGNSGGTAPGSTDPNANFTY